MRKKIFQSLVLLTLCVLAIAAGLFLLVAYRQTSADNLASLKKQAQMLVAADKQYGALDYNSLRSLDDRVTLLDAKGGVLFDNYADAAVMGSHLQRQEVQQALTSGEGYATRMSDTLAKEVIYYAVRLPDGHVLRLARTTDTILAQFNHMIYYFAGIFVLIMLGAFVAAKFITAQVIKPLEQLDLEQPESQQTYPELQPLLLRLAGQQQKLDKEMRRYKNKKQELKAVTNNMDEGLLFLGNAGEIVSINKSALKFFGREKQELIGQNVLTLDLGRDVEQLLEKIEEQGKASILLTKGSSYYQINGSRVSENGVVLLIMDVTEKTASEKLRREFSANVSHELKTPLQSVLGYSEIMLTGLVKEDDKPRFLQKIYDEAKNLLALIDDIIKLSRLDEQQQNVFEEFDLRAAVESAVQRVSHKAQQHQVDLKLECSRDHYPMKGMPSLLEEVFVNLLDNAVKYNHAGGSVLIRLGETENKWVATVSDTGLGIALEEKDRIFERFYRIDKSRSKDIEGTGIGLSIVKHGVMFHKGSIKVNSRVGQGTEFIIKLPKQLV